MSETTDQGQKPKPKRSMAERIVVQGGIAVLLIVVAFEGFSHFCMTSAFGKLTSAVKASETSGAKVTKEVIDKLMGGKKPDKTLPKKASAGTERYDIYYYKGPIKKRVLCVHYGIQGKDGSAPEVINVSALLPDEIIGDLQ